MEFHDHYPKIEYSEAEFVQDNRIILNWSGNEISDIAEPKAIRNSARISNMLHMKVIDPPDRF